VSSPTLADLKDYLGIEDEQDDSALQESLDAAIAAQRRVCALPYDAFGDEDYTPDMVLAIHIRAQRYVARRNSPEGVVGLSGAGGDFVSARLPSFDADVLHLEGPYRKIPVA
jgi:hypothetical protein